MFFHCWYQDCSFIHFLDRQMPYKNWILSFLFRRFTKWMFYLKKISELIWQSCKFKCLFVILQDWNYELDINLTKHRWCTCIMNHKILVLTDIGLMHCLLNFYFIPKWYLVFCICSLHLLISFTLFNFWYLSFLILGLYSLC